MNRRQDSLRRQGKFAG